LLNVPDHKRFKVMKYKKIKREKSSKFKLVYHGTFAKRLGIDLIIEAVAKLIQDIPEIQFHVYGDGDDKVFFKEVSEELNLRDFVFFHNVVPVEMLNTILLEMDVGIIGNRKNVATRYMLPVKMLEYIALDIPVIAPRLKTIEYYFDDEMICFYKPENIDDMTQKILDMYKNKDKNINRIKAARKFIDKYGWEHHQKDLLELYMKL